MLDVVMLLRSSREGRRLLAVVSLVGSEVLLSSKNVYQECTSRALRPGSPAMRGYSGIIYDRPSNLRDTARHGGRQTFFSKQRP